MTQQTDPIDRHVASRLRELREAIGLSRADLAKSVAGKASHIREYETAKLSISASKLFEIAAVLGVPVEEFFKPTEEQKHADVAAERESGLINIEFQVYRAGQQFAEGGVTVDEAMISQALRFSLKANSKKVGAREA